MAVAPADRHQTFLFADLAGFTALTEAHGDEAAADLVESFCGSVDGLLEEHDADLVKRIGDAVLVRVPDAAEAVRLGARIATDLGGRDRFPGVRVGMHTGPAVERDGDWYGATLNIASRVAGEARPGEVLITGATHEALAHAPAPLAIQEESVRRFKNVRDPVPVYSVALEGSAPARALPVDPVCHMAVDPERCETVVVDGVRHHFCSAECCEAFVAEPARYAS